MEEVNIPGGYIDKAVEVGEESSRYYNNFSENNNYYNNSNPIIQKTSTQSSSKKLDSSLPKDQLPVIFKQLYIQPPEILESELGKIYEIESNLIGRGCFSSIFPVTLSEKSINPSSHKGITYQLTLNAAEKKPHVAKIMRLEQDGEIFDNERKIAQHLRERGSSDHSDPLKRIMVVEDSGITTSPDGSKIGFLIMPLAIADLSELLKGMNNISGNQARSTLKLFLCKELILMLIQLHELDIIHSDLKPENILLKLTKDGTFILQVCDFGFSVICNSDQNSAPISDKSGKPLVSNGDVRYILKKFLITRYTDHERDIYALALIMLEIILGERLCIRKKPDNTFDFETMDSNVDRLKKSLVTKAETDGLAKLVLNFLEQKITPEDFITNKLFAGNEINDPSSQKNISEIMRSCLSANHLANPSFNVEEKGDISDQGDEIDEDNESKFEERNQLARKLQSNIGKTASIASCEKLINDFILAQCRSDVEKEKNKEGLLTKIKEYFMLNHSKWIERGASISVRKWGYDTLRKSFKEVTAGIDYWQFLPSEAKDRGDVTYYKPITPQIMNVLASQVFCKEIADNSINDSKSCWKDVDLSRKEFKELKSFIQESIKKNPDLKIKLCDVMKKSSDKSHLTENIALVLNLGKPKLGIARKLSDQWKKIFTGDDVYRVSDRHLSQSAGD